MSQSISSQLHTMQAKLPITETYPHPLAASEMRANMNAETFGRQVSSHSSPLSDMKKN